MFLRIGEYMADRIFFKLNDNVKVIKRNSALQNQIGRITSIVYQRGIVKNAYEIGVEFRGNKTDIQYFQANELEKLHS